MHSSLRSINMIFLVPQARGSLLILHRLSTYVIRSSKLRKAAKSRTNCVSSHHSYAWQDKTNSNRNLDASIPNSSSRWTAVFRPFEQLRDRSCSPANWIITPQAGIVAFEYVTMSRMSKACRQGCRSMKREQRFGLDELNVRDCYVDMNLSMRIMHLCSPTAIPILPYKCWYRVS